MKRLQGLIFVTCAAVMTVSQASFAEQLPEATYQDSSCIQVPNDPYDVGYRMGRDSEMFAGKCVNTLTKRPAKILRETTKSITFANFYHKGQYWVAKWQKSDLPKADFLIVHFDSGVPMLRVGHTEFRFRFNKGLELTSQTTGRKAVVKDLIIDWEATFIDGQSYDFMAGLKENYPVTGRVLSTESRIPENVMSPGIMRRIDQYRLNMSEALSADLFLESVRRSDARSVKYFYLTLRRNCTSELFNTIDPIMMKAGIMPRGVRGFFTPVSVDSIVGPSRAALVDRKLIDSKQPRTSFAQEFGFAEVQQ